MEKSYFRISAIKNLSKLVYFIVQFNLFCVIKHIFTSKFFAQDASLLQKLKSKIPSCIFPIKAIPSMFDEVKLAVHGSKNA